MRLSNAPRRALLALAGVALLAGCDTNNGGGDLDEVSGTYRITQLYFNPSAGAIQDADVLPLLDSADTEIRLFSDGDALFFTEFVRTGESLRTDATITGTTTQVRFNALTAQDAQELARLLLPQTFALDRLSGDILAKDLDIVANMDQFEDASGDDRDLYEGLTAVPGLLTVRFERSQ